MNTLIVVALFSSVAACASDAAPETVQDVCDAYAPSACALDAKRDTCDGETVEDAGACEARVVAECCAAFGPCDAALPADQEWPTDEEYDACEAAISNTSCSSIETKPSACTNVIK